MQSASTNYLAKNALLKKKPAYLLHFFGETTDYATTPRISSPQNTLKSCLKRPRGTSQTITPEEGKSSIGEITLPLLDKNGEILSLMANDPTNLHRKKGVLRCGYKDLAEADMLDYCTGWVTSAPEWSDGPGWDIKLTDPQRWLQQKIFKGASDTSPVHIEGNILNIALRILTSTGDGTNGPYDWYPEDNGVGINREYINIAHIEEQRDTWFRGINLSFDIRAPIVAKKFLEEEIFKVGNMYPIVRGNGVFDLIVYHYPLCVGPDVQAFDESIITGKPEFDPNFDALINAVEFHIAYDADDNEYKAIYKYYDAATLDRTASTYRGPGKKSLVIKSKGLPDNQMARDFIERRANNIFCRYAPPPPIVKVKTFYTQHLSDVGDLVPVTHSKVPNMQTGTRGITSRYMEIIKRHADFQEGRCEFTMLYTDWTGERYIVIAPNMYVTEGVSTTQFKVSAEDAAKYEEGWHIDITDAHRRIKASNLEITDISIIESSSFEDTDDVEFADTFDVEFGGDAYGQITVGSSIGATPAAGWIIGFADYDYLTDAQKLYWVIQAQATPAQAHLILP